MADIRLYWGIENVGLTDAQRDTLIEVLKGLGQANDSPYPNFRLQTRIRDDREAAIFEGVFDEDVLTIDQWKIWLGNIFGVDPETIDHSTSVTQYGRLVVFERPSGTARLRVIFFGGISPTWEESRVATVSYISDNIEDWEPGEI